MKKLLTLSLILISLKGMGQTKKDSAFINLRLDTTSFNDTRGDIILEDSSTICTYTDSCNIYRNWYNAADNILSCLNSTGYVLNKDRKRFNHAVAVYMKLIHRNIHAPKMLKLDILVRDINGNALYWVSQK